MLSSGGAARGCRGRAKFLWDPPTATEVVGACAVFYVGPATATEVHILLALIRLGTWPGLLGIHSTAAIGGRGP